MYRLAVLLAIVIVAAEAYPMDSDDYVYADKRAMRNALVRLGRSGMRNALVRSELLRALQEHQVTVELNTERRINDLLFIYYNCFNRNISFKCFERIICLFDLFSCLNLSLRQTQTNSCKKASCY
ncbi:unnamed protein product [Enterobius vermicularis]|uniref:Uncharacterized protein n=1 Tax=Enterobius vermicularis TaxID=51028 RepID=A0A0N4V398_ENTVE|nr:unnamed protein product [Enterobius vermicularis]